MGLQAVISIDWGAAWVSRKPLAGDAVGLAGAVARRVAPAPRGTFAGGTGI